MVRFNRALLVFPSFKNDLGSARPSPSIAYLAQALKEAGIEYDVMDMSLGYTFDDLKTKIASFKPEMLGFTIFTLNHKTVFKMLEKLKDAFPEIKLLVGGPHVSIFGVEILQKFQAIDYVCVGEGEDLIVELCTGKDIHTIKGLGFREGTKTHFSGTRPYKDNLDELRFPKLERFKLKKYAGEILIISSRGCPYSCIYCSVSLVLGKKVRIRSTKDVVDEIEYWYQKGRRIFNFFEDNFTFYKDRVYAICGEIEKRNLKGLTLRASNGVRADRLDYDLLKRMKEVGFKSIGIGVEAGNDNILKTLKKGETITQIESTIKNACDLGYEVALFFVVGTPGETWQDIEDSIRIALKYRIFKVDFYNLIPFPGTELYGWVNQHNAWLGDPEELLNSSGKNIRFGSKPFFATEALPYATRVRLSKRLLKVMRKVEINYFKQLFRKKIGFLAGYPLAYLMATAFMQRLYFNNNKFRKIAEKIRYFLISK